MIQKDNKYITKTFNKPDFLCIGFQKAGTTWLHANLMKHPQIFLPPVKEIHFFDERHRNVKQSLYYRLTDKHFLNYFYWKTNLVRSFKYAVLKKNIPEIVWLFKYFFSPRTYNWYSSLFSSKTHHLCGDITPDYCIINEDIVKEISFLFPNIKIYVLLRNPVERTWSAIKGLFLQGYQSVDKQSIEKAIEAYYNSEWKYFDDYERIFKIWTKYFSDNKLFFAFHDQLVENPQEFFLNAIDFLGVHHFIPENINKQIHVGKSFVLNDNLKKILIEKNIANLNFLARFFDSNNIKYPLKWLNEANIFLENFNI